jgi:hypothetical protein
MRKRRKEMRKRMKRRKKKRGWRRTERRVRSKSSCSLTTVLSDCCLMSESRGGTDRDTVVIE